MERKVMLVMIAACASVYCGLTEVAAQKVSYPCVFLSKSFGRITAILDTMTGRYAVRRNDGASILFLSEVSATSHMSVRVGGVTYANYRWIGLGREPWVRNLGKGAFVPLPDRLRYRWTLATPHGACEVTQDLVPDSGDGMDRVTVSIRARALSSPGMRISCALVQDLTLAGDDNPSLEADGRLHTRTAVFDGPRVPGSWRAHAQAFGADTVYGIVRDAGFPEPARVVLDRYASHGHLGTAVVGYRPIEQSIVDAGVYTEWHESDLEPGRETLLAAVRVALASARSETMTTTFGTSFTYNWQRSEGFGLVSDSLALVRIVADDDLLTESVAQRDGRWDTTFILQPDAPVQLLLIQGLYHPPDTQIVYMSRMSLRVFSDRCIGVVGWGGRHDITILYPDSLLGRRYVVPGSFADGSLSFNALDDTTTVRFDGFKIPWRIMGGPKFHVDSIGPVTRIIPPQGYISAHKDGWSNIWIYPAVKKDGSGLICESDRRFGVVNCVYCPLVNTIIYRGDSVGVAMEQCPPEPATGRHHLYVPFTRDACVAGPAESLLRIIVQFDATELAFDGRPIGGMWRTGDVIDTLLSHPVEIHASRPVAVYQYALTHSYFHCRIGSGAMTALLPEEGWAQRYWTFNRLTMPHYPGDLRGWDNENPYPDYHRVTIVARQPRGIFVDGSELPASGFLRHGSYHYIDMEVTGDFTRIHAQDPISVVAYGWLGAYGYAYTPPRK